MKNTTLFACLSLESMGAFFATITPDQLLSIIFLGLSIISLVSSLIIKLISKVKAVKNEQKDPLEAAEESLKETLATADELKSLIQQYKKVEKKTSIYRVKE